MAHFKKVNNERSEAIELIKWMDATARRNTWQIKSVGGESTLNTGSRRMFPDIFIYGDTARTRILQGWEVKMPDVPITDPGFISDAQRKAEVLGVNSCFLWNFTYGVLYVRTDGCWEKAREWTETSHIRTRRDVETRRSDWEALIAAILSELNGFFASGKLLPARIGEIVTSTVFAELILRNKAVTAEYLKDCGTANTAITAQISQWWKSVEREYRFDEADKFSAYAKFILLNWINKLTFAHMIKGNHNPAAAVEKINSRMSPQAALALFSDITAQCDFYNIFAPVPLGALLPEATWLDLTDYNAFLSENGLSQIPQAALQTALESSLDQFKRNVSGVFATPPRLAKILVNAGISDLTAPAIDPCCGTGTIAAEILSAKEAAIGVEKAFASTFAADKFSFPLQVSNIAMTRVNAINIPSQLFQSNVFDLYEGKEVSITDPQTGKPRQHTLPKWGSVVSNLPFVAFDQDGREESGLIASVIEQTGRESGLYLSGRSDLYQAILLHLHGLLADHASLGVVTSNSWLGTLAGQTFFRALQYYYSVESIVASGDGRWFHNADVVAVLLFLKHRPVPKPADDGEAVCFGLLHKPLSRLTDGHIAQVVESILLKSTLSPELLSFRQYTAKQLRGLLDMNITLNACFYDINWLFDVRDLLCPVSNLFEVFRGMKTGQDEIYYLRSAEDVDGQYIGRVFKSAKSADRLIVQPDTYAFVCDRSLAELEALGHTRTLAWIDRYKGHLNRSVPNKDTFWKNLSNGSFSGSQKIRLFTGMNPERRIFYGLLEQPAQINQRAIGFRPLSDAVNLELCHALLNSVLGVFYTEATGFPKGLGALDNRAENTKKILMPDPRRLSAPDAEKILRAFRPLQRRKILNTAEEYLQADRIAFERVVAECFGYAPLFERIKNCVLQMQRVRLSVKKAAEAEEVG